MRLFKRTSSRSLRGALVAGGMAAVLALVAVPVGTSSGAQAASYPSWADVQQARASEAATKSEIARISSLIAGLQGDLDAAQAAEKTAGDAYDQAQQASDRQELTTARLQADVTAAKVEADTAERRARRLLATLSKAGGGDLTAGLLSRPGEADSLLYRLSTLSRLTSQSESIYANALRLSNNASALERQAQRAQTKLRDLRDVAQQALTRAQATSDAATAAYDAQEQHRAQLAAQLSVLTQRRQATEADYNAGQAAQRAATAVGAVTAYGWARPVSGYIVSGFGMRLHPIYKVWKLHSGVDIAGQGCGAPIFATHAGRVTYSGWSGDLGYYIQIDHQDGTLSGYAHIVAGGLLVARGEEVRAGQQIAHVGTTGGSTGCHLHFLVRQRGVLTDPVPFMRERGVALG